MNSKDQSDIGNTYARPDHLDQIDALLRRQRSISVLYSAGAGTFMVAALWFHDERLAIPVYLLFIAWLWLRYRVLKEHRIKLSRQPGERQPDAVPDASKDQMRDG